jgi:hypothetical protein
MKSNPDQFKFAVQAALVRFGHIRSLFYFLNKEGQVLLLAVQEDYDTIRCGNEPLNEAHQRSSDLGLAFRIAKAKYRLHLKQ